MANETTVKKKKRGRPPKKKVELPKFNNYAMTAKTSL